MLARLRDLLPTPLARVLCWLAFHRQHGWRSWCWWFQGRLR
jgi:hypothetical protein